MSRKKKNRGDQWESFINKILKRPRAKRDYVLPADYIMAVASNIHKTNPSLEITYNTLVEFAGVIYEKGYTRKEEDIRWFKEKKEKRLKEGFNAFKDWLDDLVHSNNKKQ